MECLESNKEDTANAIVVIGELQVEVDELKEELTNAKLKFLAYEELQVNMEKRLNNAYTVGNIIIVSTTVPMIVAGSILMASGNEYGKPLLYTGLGSLVGIGIVWNGGRWLFKLW